MTQLAVRSILHKSGFYRVFVLAAVINEGFGYRRNSNCFSGELEAIHHVEALRILLLLRVFDEFAVLLLDVAPAQVAEHLTELVGAEAVHEVCLEHELFPFVGVAFHLFGSLHLTRSLVFFLEDRVVRVILLLLTPMRGLSTERFAARSLGGLLVVGLLHALWYSGQLRHLSVSRSSFFLDR